jgi:hypothetical protein
MSNENNWIAKECETIKKSRGIADLTKWFGIGVHICANYKPEHIYLNATMEFSFTNTM